MDATWIKNHNINFGPNDLKYYQLEVNSEDSMLHTLTWEADQKKRVKDFNYIFITTFLRKDPFTPVKPQCDEKKRHRNFRIDIATSQ